MADEEPLFPLKSFFMLIMVVAWLAVIVLAVFLFFSINVEIKEGEMERVVVEVADALTKERLTNGLALFSAEELGKWDGTKAEPYYRHCRYAYRVKIDDGTRKWEFGYKPDNVDKYSAYIHVNFPTEERKLAARYPVGVIDNGTVKPAVMELTIYRTAMTEASCLAWSAHTLGSVQSMQADCPSEGSHYSCGMPVVQRGDYLCLFYVDEIDNGDTTTYIKIYTNECRYNPGIDVLGMYSTYTINTKAVMKAVPVRASAAAAILPDGRCFHDDKTDQDVCEASPYPLVESCSELQQYAAAPGEPAAIALCFEGDEG